MRFHPLLLAVLGSLLVAGPGPHAEAAAVRHVAMEDDYFYPSSVTAPQGGVVSWDATGDQSHTATDGSGMDLFDSGLVESGGPSFTFMFTTAASYPVICALHEAMLGRVRVPLRAGPRDGTVDGPFVVTWASERPADGFVVDVSVRRPGRPWRAWKSGTETTHDRFRPSVDGIYRFRSRLRAAGTEARADWSDIVLVRVRS